MSRNGLCITNILLHSFQSRLPIRFVSTTCKDSRKTTYIILIHSYLSYLLCLTIISEFRAIYIFWILSGRLTNFDMVGLGDMEASAICGLAEDVENFRKDLSFVYVLLFIPFSHISSKCCYPSCRIRIKSNYSNKCCLEYHSNNNNLCF